jgi:hypothetical protein
MPLHDGNVNALERPAQLLDRRHRLGASAPLPS